MIPIRGSRTTVEVVLGAVVSWGASPHVVGVAGPHVLLADLVRGQDGADVQGVVRHECR